VTEKDIDGVIGPTLRSRGRTCAHRRWPARRAGFRASRFRALDRRACQDAQAARPQRALIGVGGVDSAQTALEKIRAGADLVQL